MNLPSVARRLATSGKANCALLVAAFLTSSPTTASAWGPEGHEVIALIALQQLTPAAKRGVDALLALEPEASLASIVYDPGASARRGFVLPLVADVERLL